MKKVTVLALAVLTASLAQAQIKVGVTVSATGPAASLGIPEKNTVDLLPKTIGGLNVEYIVLDDKSDTSTAVQNAKKLIQDGVDVIIGSTTTPNSLALIDVVADAKVPLISLGASEAIIKPMDAKKAWVFKTPQTDALMAEAVAEHMASTGVKTAAYIGFSDSYGEGWWNEFSKYAEKSGIKIVANERYARSDTSVTGQILKIVAAKPEAVLVGASGTPAVLPQATLKDRGFNGKVYQTHGVANADFLRVGGKDVEGAILPAGPILVADQLASNHPNRAMALNYIRAYEKKFGAGSRSTFGAHMWDAGLILQRAIPLASKKGKPGTPEFKKALRDAIESTKGVVGTHGIFTMSKNDHLGLDGRAKVMVQVVGGTWKLIK